MIRFKYDFSFCITAEVLIASLIAVCMTLHLTRAVSLLFAASFIVLLGFTVPELKAAPTSAAVILLLVLCAVNVTFNGLLEDAVLSFSYFKKLIMFSSFIIFMNYVVKYNEDISPAAFKTLKLFPVAASFFLIFSYFILNNRETVAGGITLGLTNPNITGMWILHCIIFTFLFVIDYRNAGKFRLLFIPVLFLLAYLLFKTRSRASMLGLICFLLLLSARCIFRLMPKWMIFAIALFPIVFVILYLNIVDAEWFQNIFSFIVSRGKALNSRVGMWTYALDKFMKHPLTGNYAGISEGTGLSQMHNIHLDVLCSYGVIPFVLFMDNLSRNLLKVGSSVRNFYQYSSFCGFCAVILTGTFEAALVSGAAGLNLLTTVLLALSYAGDGQYHPAPA